VLSVNHQWYGRENVVFVDVLFFSRAVNKDSFVAE